MDFPGVGIVTADDEGDGEEDISVPSRANRSAMSVDKAPIVTRHYNAETLCRVSKVSYAVTSTIARVTNQ